MIPIRNHHLKDAGRSLQHCIHMMQNEERDPTKAFERGTNVHASLFGTAKIIRIPDDAPNKPNKKQRTAKKPSKETVAAIEWWDAFEAECEGVGYILTDAEYDKCMRMTEAIHNCPAAMDLVTASEHERTILFDINGRACRTTPDMFGDSFIAELKTARSSKPEEFTWQSRRLNYRSQLAWHMTGAERIGRKVREAYTIAVEDDPRYPKLHVVTVFRAVPRMLNLGARFNALQFERIRAAEESVQWPPYSQMIVDMDDAPEEIDLDWSNMPDEGEDEAA